MRHYLAYQVRVQCFANWNIASFLDAEFQFLFVFRDQVVQCGSTGGCGLGIKVPRGGSIIAGDRFGIRQATPVHPELVTSIWNDKLLQEVPWDEMLFSTCHESIRPKMRELEFANAIGASGCSKLERPLALFCRCNVSPAAKVHNPPSMTPL
jgi:hypothetical protein